MAKRPTPCLLLTCEHGGHEIPPPYRPLFRGAANVLKSHRGWDPGALHLAKLFEYVFDAELHFATTSRLLVELNRSLHHRRLFSQYTQDLDRAAKQRVIDDHYRPYRHAVEQSIRRHVKNRQAVLHLSVHSFTPQLDGEVRNADIGLLYDPARPREKAFADAWREELLRIAPELRVRRNYPYLGTADGFTTYLRTQFEDASYAGIELEVNQRFPLGSPKAWKDLQTMLVESLRRTLFPLT